MSPRTTSILPTIEPIVVVAGSPPFHDPQRGTARWGKRKLQAGQPDPRTYNSHVRGYRRRLTATGQWA
jgi:hypothetical protein